MQQAAPTLLVDNYDSYTYNLFQLIAVVTGQRPVVVRNDECSWDTLARQRFGRIVLSPGPGRPGRARDFGVCAEIARNATVPTLGVCLGHQGIAEVWGATVVHAPRPMHGKVSRIYHDGAGLFAGIQQGFRAVRYHSLIVTGPLPDALERIAWCADGTIMGVAHRERPLWGVQFHPESVATEFGAELMRNFHSPRAARPAAAAAEPAASGRWAA